MSSELWVGGKEAEKEAIDLSQVRRQTEFNTDENKVVRNRLTVFTKTEQRS